MHSLLMLFLSFILLMLPSICRCYLVNPAAKIKEGRKFLTRQLSLESKGRILSGIQPSGSLHIGNYLGAIKQWVRLQEDYESYFCIVDYHAITVPQDPRKLSQETLEAAALYIAAGINPSKSKVFVQSHVPAHCELTWIFNCITPMNWLERMIQYKEKAVKHGENVGVGLFSYPILMAADILLYQADFVPVGEDQRQHLELTRDIARRFNSVYQPTFKEPLALIVEESSRIMSLQDGKVKMSKSAENDNSRINLLDPPEVIAKKIRRCKTDAYSTIEWDPLRPEASNLLNIYQAVTDKSKEEISREVLSLQWGTFKSLLEEALVQHLKPLQSRYQEIIADKHSLLKILHDGRNDASYEATKTLTSVKNAVGITSSIELWN